MRISDIIAYLGKDRQDAQELGLFETSPKYYEGKIGTTNSEIINNMIVNIVENSYGKDYLKMDEDFFEAFSQGKRGRQRRFRKKSRVIQKLKKFTKKKSIR